MVGIRGRVGAESRARDAVLLVDISRASGTGIGGGASDAVERVFAEHHRDGERDVGGGTVGVRDVRCFSSGGVRGGVRGVWVMDGVVRDAVASGVAAVRGVRTHVWIRERIGVRVVGAGGAVRAAERGIGHGVGDVGSSGGSVRVRASGESGGVFKRAAVRVEHVGELHGGGDDSNLCPLQRRQTHHAAGEEAR